MNRFNSVLFTLVLFIAGSPSIADDGTRLVSVDHYVRVKSTAPAIVGEEALLYVREVVLAGVALRHVERISLAGWSQGGPRTGGYAARHPAKVARLVVLAPAYLRAGPNTLPKPPLPAEGSMTAQSQADFVTGWDGQVGCADQYDPATSAVVWTDMLASDPVGATWGTGVRRAPRVPSYGFNQDVVSKMTTPYLMIIGAHDKQVVPDRVRELYADLGSKQKILVELACSSHSAMWEKNHLLLFRASLEWLKDGKVNGMSEGQLKLGN
jgi:pimeloyl-ACP methyl ester carboxylesterase